MEKKKNQNMENDGAVNIVLVEPEIPQNTGSIARTCAAAGVRLHLVKPLGFTLDDRSLKRAGLDYWNLLDICYHESLKDFLQQLPETANLVLSSTKAPWRYTDFKFEGECYLLFGPETRGLPEELLAKYFQSAIRIPMIAEARSLNLSNSVAIVLYEALRQRDFKDLKTAGKPVNFDWPDWC